eukprot:Gregarina_sp_Poly_1__3372@NODE_1973_length_2949_cov_301_490285_g1271_i0_p1_GENE_NODE_1973_length_2949_cov_301_490285_g1271_i0NODE_1973_length_2949_cov_301_490285_g1271_i0_p1_ORF_typecomplete_len284_score32_16Herpes_gE/PF02480_16/0_0075PepSY_TM/PF03929_16/0_14_NODE_1973_length_2949_cov_301_490285_g1271_i020232874
MVPASVADSVASLPPAKSSPRPLAASSTPKSSPPPLVDPSTPILNTKYQIDSAPPVTVSREGEPYKHLQPAHGISIPAAGHANVAPGVFGHPDFPVQHSSPAKAQTSTQPIPDEQTRDRFTDPVDMTPCRSRHPESSGSLVLRGAAARSGISKRDVKSTCEPLHDGDTTTVTPSSGEIILVAITGGLCVTTLVGILGWIVWKRPSVGRVSRRLGRDSDSSSQITSSSYSDSTRPSYCDSSSTESELEFEDRESHRHRRKCRVRTCVTVRANKQFFWALEPKKK